jgi:FkbM family methyltransferase
MSLIRTIAKTVLPAPVTIRLRAAFKHHEFERRLLPALCDPFRAGLDVGAALGAYTWPLSQLCGSCIAFEPNLIQAEYLRRAFGASLRVENVALSNRNGDIELVIPVENGRDMAGLATIGTVTHFDGCKARRQMVAMRTLDSYELKPVGFIKVDVEGHELAVLEGAAAVLRRDRPNLLVELEERFAEGSIARAQTFLERLGYRGMFLQNQRLHPLGAFDPALHQAMANWGTLGTYINNFIFCADEQLAATVDLLARLGYLAEI